MSSYLVQSDTDIFLMSHTGVTTQVTLPTGITLYGAATPCRTALFQIGETPIIIVVNGGTHDFYIDEFGVARQLQLSAPTGYPTPTAGVGTGLNGIYKVAATFKIKDENGLTIIESGLGPISIATGTLANKTIRLDAIPVSNDGTVNARGLYRTLTGGSVLYPWFDIDNNTTLIEDRGVVDSLLSILPTEASRFGAPPDLKLITAWKSRLWGAPRLPNDSVRWTEEDNFYGWSEDNELLVPPIHADDYGVTALIPRRDYLGIARRKALFLVTGNSNDSFQRVGVSESLGCVSQESVVVIQNVAYMLGDLGVNEWSDAGMKSVSDTQVGAWFTTDDYFNRSLFSKAQGRYNPDTNCYELLLASIESSSALDQWVSYDLSTKQWLGPHKTDAFTPTCTGTSTSQRGTLTDADDLSITVFGSGDGYVYRRDETALTDHQTAVEFQIELPFLSTNEPDIDKHFGRPTIHSRPEERGTLTVTPIVGNLDDDPDTPLYHDLTLDRETLDRLGRGRYCQLTLNHNSKFEGFSLYGIEIPYVFIGRR